MTLIDDYVRDVLSRLPVSAKDRARIESDLREHLTESVAAGDTEAQAVKRMGPPEEVAAELMSTLTPLYGAPARRLGAMIFDCVLAYGTMFLIGLATINILSSGMPNFTWTAIGPLGTFQSAFNGGIEDSGYAPLLLVPFFLLISMLPLAYFVLSEWLTGRTIGKWLFGLTVSDDTGHSPSFVRALIRRLSIFFTPALIIDGVAIFVTEKRQRASELLAHTVVLSVPDAPPAAVGWMSVVALTASASFTGYMLFSRFLSGVGG